MISTEKENYIQAIVARLFKCPIGCTHPYAGCPMNFRHLALAACRELAIAEADYTRGLEVSERLFEHSKSALNVANETAAKYESESRKLNQALTDIEQIIERARK